MNRLFTCPQIAVETIPTSEQNVHRNQLQCNAPVLPSKSHCAYVHTCNSFDEALSMCLGLRFALPLDFLTFVLGARSNVFLVVILLPSLALGGMAI